MSLLNTLDAWLGESVCVCVFVCTGHIHRQLGSSLVQKTWISCVFNDFLLCFVALESQGFIV